MQKMFEFVARYADLAPRLSRLVRWSVLYRTFLRHDQLANSARFTSIFEEKERSAA
jgi:hypothetical protein